MTKRRIAAALTTTIAALVTAGSGFAPAMASDSPGDTFNIRSITVQSVHVRSTSCVYTPIAVTVDAGSATGGDVDFNATIDFWRGSKQVDSDYVYDSVNPASSVFTIRDNYMFCPYSGLGSMRTGPSQVDGTAYDSDYNTLADEQFTDYTRGTFVAKASTVTALSTTRLSGNRTKFTAVPRYFSVDYSGWKRWGNKYVTLQRQTSAGSWVRVATMKTSSRGVAVTTLKVSRGQKYRVLTPGTTVAWTGTSATRAS